MFAPGDYVIYSVEGVCLVEEAGQLNVPGLERGRSYYRLTPYYRGGVIYTPVDGKAAIRPVMTKPALQALLPGAAGDAGAGRRSAGPPPAGRLLPRDSCVS